MKAALLYEGGDVRVEETADPDPDGWALVSSKAAGVCGTELHFVEGMIPPPAYPFQLGHESAGVVLEAPAGSAVAAGDRVWVTLAYASDEDNKNRRAMSDQEAEAALSRTLGYWNQWSELCTYRGPYEDLVRRSALMLKLLTFNPTGALVAAPTTSLPEEIGGERNWDYRFTWLRDSSLILDALHGIGYQQEAVDFFDWLDELSVKREEHVRLMYTVTGQAVPPEQALDHLEGYRGSRPVRIGNAAATQVQLDVSGEILEAAHLCYSRLRAIQPDLWRVLRAMADGAAEHWHEPDHGIWEIRSAPRHFLHSKLLCWIALDRAVRLAATGGLQGDLPYWRRTRDEIRHAILSDGFDRDIGAFVQAFDHRVLDASALVIPLVGFLPATDPRVLSTVECIRKQLTSHGLVYRYRTDDGLPGGEATFTLCSFWLVDNLALSGALDEARELFERITGYANDVGLLSEQIQPATGELSGNFPQGFTHLALIRSAINIGRTETEGAEMQARVPGERSQARVAAIR